MMQRGRLTLSVLAAASLAVAACGGDDGDAADSSDATPLEIVAFSPPSLGAFLPAVIADQRFDLDNGLDISFVERPPDAYNTEFGTGQFQVGGSGSLMSEAVRLTEGIDVVYLFNVHDFWGGLVSTTPDVASVTDLEGHSLAGVTGSTNYAMFRWFAETAGVDFGAVTVESHDTGALGTQAQTSRSDAIQIWEPGYSLLMAQELDHVHDVPLPLELWEQEFGTTDIPFLGIAVHRSWLDENEELVAPLHATYEQAAEWSLANPDEAAQIIADSIEGGGDAEALAGLLADNDRLGLNVRWSSDVADGIAAVFDAGVTIGYFDESPSLDIVYEGN
ncbi:ABC transporter substrate-binding protein [Phytoactinopolyspora limicola]|uniref:ABC transporter substrate-binding protein n=1 Tax=Phytoactinopolyspora limicola TaxID=2715536 RepID=UPI001409AB2C|nr:ABC transporter substrate-binding protein [Phytoactinopolyspora limicola]